MPKPVEPYKVTDGLMPFFEQKLCAVFLCKPKVNKSSHTQLIQKANIAVPTWKLVLAIYRLNYQGMHTLIVMLYPCSHFYFDTKFGDRLYSKRRGEPDPQSLNTVISPQDLGFSRVKIYGSSVGLFSFEYNLLPKTINHKVTSRSTSLLVAHLTPKKEIPTYRISANSFRP